MAPPAAEPLSGPRRAAILFVLLGEETATKLTRELPGSHVEAIARELAALDTVDPATAQNVLEEYFVDAVRPEPIRGGPELARRLLSQVATTPERVARVIGRADSGALDAILAPLLDAPPAALARALAEEHPQTAALVLAGLPTDRAAATLAEIPEEQRAKTVQRMASMRQVQGDVIDAVAASLRERIATDEGGETGTTLDGLARTAAVLSTLGRAAARRLLEQIEGTDPQQAAALRERIFTFESLLLADDRGIQELLRQVETKTVAVALRGADEAIQKKLLSNLSERAAGMLKDEMEFLSAVRPDEQAAARRELLTAAQRLEEEGRLVFAASDGGGGRG
jgi:flagellar motor switch protein FliG